MAIELRRGCGYRKVSGLYLVGGALDAPCHRLPFPLTVCPCCGGGIKQARGWTWVDPVRLLGECVCTSLYKPHYEVCPVCNPMLFAFERTAGEGQAPELDKRCGLLWIGGAFYKSPAEFIYEGKTLGVSRRIAAIPRGFVVGKTRVLLAHAKACITQDDGGDRMGPGIFAMFTPQRIEKIVTDRTPEDELEKLHKQGITPVVVPHDDKDHQGTVYDKEEDEAA